jgi:hypothetical protein
MESNLNVHFVTSISVFLGLQFLFGRKASLPYGVFVKFSLFKMVFLIFLSDLLLTFLILNGLDTFFRRVKVFLKKKAQKKSQSPLWAKLVKLRNWGLLMVTANPYLGGSLWGCIFAHSIKINKILAFFIITLGCLLCTFITWLIVAAII